MERMIHGMTLKEYKEAYREIRKEEGQILMEKKAKAKYRAMEKKIILRRVSLVRLSI
ncbi:MAG: hypothetical protein J7L20_05560 [Thermoplasmata archaeon]|nr:hypothetical protein [Thermoplasmata archaeon]